MLIISLSIFLVSVQTTEAQYAPPTFVAVSAIAASTGADVTITIPTAWEPNDIFLVMGVVRDQDDTVTLNGYTAATGSPFNRNTASRYWVFWKRATTSESNPLFDKSTATGDTFVLMNVYRGALLIGTPFDFGASATGTSDPASCTALITTVNGNLAIAALAGEDDNNAAITVTGTDPRNYVEHYAESATGTDGMVTFSEMGQQALGTTGSVSVNFDVANPVGWGCMLLSLKPQSSGGGGSGTNSLVKTTSEPSGGNCANGGIKVESGLDNGDGGGTANDGILQNGEVDSTSYVCNGAPGTNGSNGQDGFNALVNTTLEGAGVNCVAGGFKVDSGLDNGDGGGTARNNFLESGEIDQTDYVCHGQTGATGATGPQGPEGPAGPSGPVRPAWILFIMGLFGSASFIAWGFQRES